MITKKNCMKTLYYIAFVVNIIAYVFTSYVMLFVEYYLSYSYFTFSALGLFYFAKKKSGIRLLILIVSVMVLYIDWLQS
jgi:hypothetical protein